MLEHCLTKEHVDKVYESGRFFCEKDRAVLCSMLEAIENSATDADRFTKSTSNIGKGTEVVPDTDIGKDALLLASEDISDQPAETVKKTLSRSSATGQVEQSFGGSADITISREKENVNLQKQALLETTGSTSEGSRLCHLTNVNGGVRATALLPRSDPPEGTTAEGDLTVNSSLVRAAYTTFCNCRGAFFAKEMQVWYERGYLCKDLQIFVHRGLIADRITLSELCKRNGEKTPFKFSSPPENVVVYEGFNEFPPGITIKVTDQRLFSCSPEKIASKTSLTKDTGVLPGTINAAPSGEQKVAVVHPLPSETSQGKG
ncbi:hypothetical protein OESDEN_05571 [Oesophagostomum dentatum]|uniref:Uncharacterized protein n=1 Tax=Oesophagostomum dentatum TaxID=61180 RepID=A0A0B1TB61_OESDE|nr:hypothetical protein OESDEN_05571 [Oesophagostomum dentatum]